MATTVSMPQLGETVTEGTILRWAKQVGDTIAEDEVLVEISTDKVDTEVPSPAAGTAASTWAFYQWCADAQMPELPLAETVETW